MYRLIIPAAVFIFCCSSCTEKKVEAKEDPQKYCLSDTMKQMIKLDSVQYCNITNAVGLNAQVSFNENKVIKIFPRGSGAVISCSVSLGDKVKAGQVLAVIKSADVAGNFADLTAAEADADNAKREMDNAAALYKSGISSEKEYAEQKNNYDKALAAKRKIQSLIGITSGSGATAAGTYTLTSPIDGYIVEKNINPGNFIREDNSESMFTISDLKDVWVIASVFESDIQKVHLHSNVQVSTIAYPDKIYDGTVDNISSTIDPQDKTLKVRIRLSNPDVLLKPQMFAKVTVADTSSAQSLCIPASAIISDNGMSYVVAYFNDCNLKVLPVYITTMQGDRAYIQNSLKRGQLVVTENELMLYQQLTGQ